jgi:HEPN domain-containing protein
MTGPSSLLASARRILEGAARDCENGLHMSACAGAQRAAAMAAEAWLRAEGQPIVRARLLDRYRIDEGPHGSAGGVGESPRESAEAVRSARRVLEFIDRRLGPER